MPSPAGTINRDRSNIAAFARLFIVGACALLGSAAMAQTKGYMRVVTPRGVIAGKATDPARSGWILLRHANMPSVSEIEAMSEETAETTASAANAKASGDPRAEVSKVVHRPVVVIKDKDSTSMALMIAQTSHQVLPEVDIALTNATDSTTVTYRLKDATIISIRGGESVDGSDAPLEQLRFNYAKIEIVR